MKRIFKFFLLLITMAIIFKTNSVMAGVNHGYSSTYINDCTNNKSCILLCAYTNKVKYTSDLVEQANYNYFSSYIYYNINEKNYFVEWISQETDINKAFHSNLLGDKDIKIDNLAKNNLTNNGKCPENSYVDIAGLASEVCFSDETSYCISNMSNAGTTFKGDSINAYNYENEINSYFKTWAPDLTKYSCQDLQNKNIDIENQFSTDFSTNFLNGNAIPNFMKNSTSYKNGLSSLYGKIDTLQSKCDEEEEKIHESGETTLEEYEENIQKNEEGAQQLKEQVEEAIEKIEIGTSNFGNDIEEIDKCSSLLGEPSDEGSPAYYLSILFSIIRYISIILLIVLTVMDFVSAISSQDNDILKKATSKAIKRVIICVIIFILPILIDFILQFVHDSSISDCISLNS